MNLYHLRYFVTLAHMEHYTRAADLLAITQPSLSHAISSLESELVSNYLKRTEEMSLLPNMENPFLRMLRMFCKSWMLPWAVYSLPEKERGTLILPF